MKTLMFATAVMALTGAISLSPASAAQDQSVTPDALHRVTVAPHYEWQYHYVGRHARYVGHWVRVQ